MICARITMRMGMQKRWLKLRFNSTNPKADYLHVLCTSRQKHR